MRLQKNNGRSGIALGVPTVISIPSLACDIMDSFCASQGEKWKIHFLLGRKVKSIDF